MKIKFINNVKIRKQIELNKWELKDKIRIIVFTYVGMTYKEEISLEIQNYSNDFEDLGFYIDDCDDIENIEENRKVLLKQGEKIKKYLNDKGYKNVKILEENV